MTGHILGYDRTHPTQLLLLYDVNTACHTDRHEQPLTGMLALGWLLRAMLVAIFSSFNTRVDSEQVIRSRNTIHVRFYMFIRK
jgi:hypothetical protein